MRVIIFDEALFADPAINAFFTRIVNVKGRAKYFGWEIRTGNEIRDEKMADAEEAADAGRPHAMAGAGAIAAFQCACYAMTAAYRHGYEGPVRAISQALIGLQRRTCSAYAAEWLPLCQEDLYGLRATAVSLTALAYSLFVYYAPCVIMSVIGLICLTFRISPRYEISLGWRSARQDQQPEEVTQGKQDAEAAIESVLAEVIRRSKLRREALMKQQLPSTSDTSSVAREGEDVLISPSKHAQRGKKVCDLILKLRARGMDTQVSLANANKRVASFADKAKGKTVDVPTEVMAVIDPEDANKAFSMAIRELGKKPPREAETSLQDLLLGQHESEQLIMEEEKENLCTIEPK